MISDCHDEKFVTQNKGNCIAVGTSEIVSISNVEIPVIFLNYSAETFL